MGEATPKTLFIHEILAFCTPEWLQDTASQSPEKNKMRSAKSFPLNVIK